VVKDLTFDVKRGEVFAIVGESGSGKSTSAQAIMGLLPKLTEVTGVIKLAGSDISALSPQAKRKILGTRISLISQDALSSLNPSTTVGFQIAEMLMYHRGVSRKDAFARAVELLHLTGIPSAAERVHSYPHQFSGGMRQRALIAMALALEPELLVADEPTTALDATIKAQILELLSSLRAKFGMSVLLITHDMGAVARLADRMLVMYAGQAMEVGDVHQVFSGSRHPYTAALLRSIPSLQHPGTDLQAIPGAPPTADEDIPGCSFHTRCPRVEAACKVQKPAEVVLGDGHRAACLFAREWKFP
jgi:oligopeptide/dipeptide ABC transporter ATP-binding protein